MRQISFAAALLASAAVPSTAWTTGDGRGTTVPQASASCEVEKVIEVGIERARKEAEAFAARKNEELAGEMQRAERSDKRIQQGDNYSWEGHSTRQHIAIDVPSFTVRTAEKSFDFVGTGMRVTKVLGVKMHVPQFWRKTVKIDLPVKIETSMKRQDFYFETPSLTIRDNQGDLKDANEKIKKIRDEIPAGESGIKERHKQILLKDVEDALAKSERASLSELNQAEAAALETLEQRRSELLAAKNYARAQLAEVHKENEADAAFSTPLKVLDDAIGKMKADYDEARENVSKQIAKVKDDYLNNRLTTGSCEATKS
jgi:hypothetical protein